MMKSTATDGTTPDTPVIVKPKLRKRRLAGLLFFGVLAAVGIAAVTTAAFTDSEYAGFNSTGGGLGAATWNIQVAGDSGAWLDTTSPLTPGTADNLATDTAAPAVVAGSSVGNVAANNLIPGDATTNQTFTFTVRNAPNSTQSAVIDDFKLVLDTNAGTSDTALLSALQFSVSDGSATVTQQSYTDLAAGVDLSKPHLAPGDVQSYTVVVSLPDQGSATANAALQGQAAFLTAEVDGASSTS
ncbi:hypothetical protein ACFOYW_12335 [Gryllotalpicola reticulitermitis]|uniref:Ribosomally synthesized peptide with SipW-like signal peptide n=1 Tax=Gryllotalpicola reticulitermitis TaxID=1184153 RepID=A0ABV8QA12_9MICO